MIEIQSIIFNKSIWTQPMARSWLKLHNFKNIKPVHVTKNFLRYRIRKPTYNKYRIKKINP